MYHLGSNQENRKHVKYGPHRKLSKINPYHKLKINTGRRRLVPVCSRRQPYHPQVGGTRGGDGVPTV